jgi:hypothetical protein
MFQRIKKGSGIALAVFLLFITNNCGIKTDKELMKELVAIQENCNLGDNTKHGWKIDSCKNDELEKTKKSIKDKGVANSLPTLVVAFSDKDDDLAIIATYFFNWNIGNSFDLNQIAKNPELIDERVAKEFLKAFDKRKEDRYTRYAVRALANVAMIKGMQDEYWKMVDSLPKDDIGAGQFYSAAVTYGRLTVFDRIKERAEIGKPFDQLSMISSTGIIQDLTDEELKELCPWWSKYLDSENKSTAKSASRNLIFKCSGEFVDNALSSIDKRIKEMPAKDVKDFRFSVNFSRCDEKRLSEAQCKKAEVLKNKLEKM